jgi:hypothetical protein
LLSLLSGRAGFRERQLDVLGGREHRQEKEALEDEPDALQPQRTSLRIGESRDVLPIEGEHASRWRIDAAEHVQQRGLAAAGWSANGDMVAASNLERDVAHGVDRSGRHRKRAADLLRVNDHVVHPITSSRRVAAIGRLETIRIG